jgi:outer membrane lipoprotein-sorting protein
MISRHNILSLAALIFTSFTLGLAQDAKEIIRKADQKMQGNSNKSEMRMTIVRPDWKREITMKSWSKGRELSLILITGPARDKGTSTLKRQKELWNWQPSIDRTIKLPPSMMLQSWMGSDFTNDDLVRESSIVNDYTHVLEKDTTIAGMDCYKIIMTPKPDAPVVWGKLIVYIEKVELNQLLVYYYDEDGFLVNTMELSEIRNMDGRNIPTRLEMMPAEEPENKTIIEYLTMDFDIDITDSFFSVQNMKRVR